MYVCMYVCGGGLPSTGHDGGGRQEIRGRVEVGGKLAVPYLLN
jgi:hypothetical protein